MESTYRTWIHALKDTSGSWNCDALRRDLRTTLGTAKWQVGNLIPNPLKEIKPRNNFIVHLSCVWDVIGVCAQRVRAELICWMPL